MNIPIQNAFTKVKKSVVGKVSDALSYPSRTLSDARAQNANDYADSIRTARKVRQGKMQSNSY